MSKETFDPTRYNSSDNEPFANVLQRAINRRNFIKGGTGLAALTMFSGFGLSGCSDDDDDNPSNVSSASLGFESIAGSRTDAITVAAGYSAMVLAPWGTPLNSTAADWRQDGTNTAEDQANSVGMHHDGMHFFPLNGSETDGLLCINHEYIDQNALHPNGATRDSATGLRNDIEEIRKEINAHGVTVVRIQLINGQWEVVKNDVHNKRFTGATEMAISGPVTDNRDLLKTKYSQDGTAVRGTLNNCGNGYTPWGTYLTCEENWPGYFVNTGTQDAAQSRLGIDDEDTRYGWDDLAGDAAEMNDEFARFDITVKGADALSDYRNEANGHGYIVEIDPYNPNSKAVKRTALGRFRHEGCVFGKLTAGEPVVFYSGHDGRFEYIYKFESAAGWDPADANSTDRLATGAKYMDEGTLYVAKFNDDGTGTWIPLNRSTATTTGGTLADTFATEADLILNTPGAADLVGATPMDRPEWCAVDPMTGSAYFTLTNNTRRQEANSANPRIDNSFGHIIRWDEGASATEFSWDIFVFGAPVSADAETNKSGLNEMNQFASPDGLVFDSRGILWVQTDNGADEVTEYTNDQMLAVVPSKLRDSGNKQVAISGDNQDNLRRFFVGPNGCEVTGLAFSPDNKTFFANIQHPGNWPFSADAAEATPAGASVRPRAATVVIRKNDGGEIGV
ncbi:monomeric alkaline phosphatase, PhoX [Oleiphilus messinensis]|uniref:Monomeric alkaline phosphatase, PhoX n=1 Tax=Oleiphilus messinensis TaxID=141451 RepID=A0A1Y0IG58_9GAMM|nr:PhoX family phosphatase [Oleiphilus messinensis]ARU58495.1 monomeric alkaline phosphatase, PhoX [Oleiphilus messinensis]